MKLMTLKPIGSGSEIYTDKFLEEGWYIVESVELHPSNSSKDSPLVAIIIAHLRENPNVKVEGTPDNFHF
jgi:hypothetical protein